MLRLYSCTQDRVSVSRTPSACASNTRHASLSLALTHTRTARILSLSLSHTHDAFGSYYNSNSHTSIFTWDSSRTIIYKTSPIWKSTFEYKIRIFRIYNNLICNRGNTWIPSAYRVSSTRDSYYAVQTTYEKILLKWKYLHFLLGLQLIWIKMADKLLNTSALMLFNHCSLHSYLTSLTSRKRRQSEDID